MREYGLGAITGGALCLVIHIVGGFVGFGFAGVFAIGVGLVFMGLGGKRDGR